MGDQHAVRDFSFISAFGLGIGNDGTKSNLLGPKTIYFPGLIGVSQLR